MGREVTISRAFLSSPTTTDLNDLERTAPLAPILNQVNCAGKSVDEGRVDYSLKFSNVAGSAGVRKLLARKNSAPREHKTFDALNFLCA
jgi:hypothetical protein